MALAGKGSQAGFLLDLLGHNPCLCLLQIPAASHIPWSVAPFPCLQSCKPDSPSASAVTFLFDSSLEMFSDFEDLCD